ncbi:MAG: hypothetical protein LKJ13_01845 [Clostridia bacterium]|jgi:hypothetical protein|nr:hypothetical protein [Clostridia bacterium]MCI1999021.1 hypothetical protein [Clostridia bacterium]MCI2013771.1 hypothetical protein [Clostridia bacterium]
MIWDVKSKSGLNIMIENFLGTIVICAFLICVSVSLIYYLSIRFGIKSHEDDAIDFMDYAISMIIFVFLSAIVLLNFVYFYIVNIKDSALYNSGLLFIFLEVASGLIIKWLYLVITKVFCVFFKNTSIYKLKKYEITWTWIFISLGLMVFYLIEHGIVYAFSYLAIILSYFIWIELSISSLKGKLKELKSLTISYWSVISFIIISGFTTIRYNSRLGFVASTAGMVLGLILSIFCIDALNKKLKNKYQTGTNSKNKISKT